MRALNSHNPGTTEDSGTRRLENLCNALNSTQDRRRFLYRAGSLALGAVALPLLGACGGDEPTTAKRLAWLSYGIPDGKPFFSRLDALGYAIDRVGSGRLERTLWWRDWTIDSPNAVELEKLPETARQILSWHPDVIVTTWHGATEAAAGATSDIPVLFWLDTDPVADGLVQSMAATGNNLTGVFWDNYTEVAGKRVELLKECFPKVTRVAILRDPRGDIGKANPIDVSIRAAESLGLSVLVVDVTHAREFVPALQRAIEDGADAVLPVTGGSVAGGPNRMRPLQDFLIRQQLPAVWDDAFYASDLRQGLISYAPDGDALFERLAEKVAQVFEGARPKDLPVERPWKFSLAVNLITARQMGATIPPSVLARATKVVT